MRGIYTAAYTATNPNASPRTMLYLTAPANKIVELIEAHMTFFVTDSSIQIEAAIQRITTLGTPTATAVTPIKHELGDQAAGSTVGANVTASEPSYTAGAYFGLECQPARSGWHWYARQAFGSPIYVANTASIGILLTQGITVTTTVDVSLVFREMG